MTQTSSPSRRGFLSLFALGIAAAGSPSFVTSAAAAPSSKLIDPKWQKTGSGSDPDAGPWADFLGEWLRPSSGRVTLVDYAGAKSAGADQALSRWIESMEQVDPTTLTADAAMAYWFNVYNAVTIQLVLEEYPVKSILRIKGGLFNTGPWDEGVFRVNESLLSLNDIEHGILRPIWQDPRVHYGVNCASIGCPNLAAKPWASATLESDLTAAAIAYVNSPRGARIEDGRLYISKIYDWFEEDFGGSPAGVINHLKAYATGPLADQLANINSIAGTEYDWDLNGT